jgi:hypothetical protein
MMYGCGVAKTKTTVYVDEEVLRAARVWAARKDMRDSDLFEQALRSFLGFDLLDRISQRNATVDPGLADEVVAVEIAAHRRRSR